jgi:Tol biopolymer transport system component
MLARVSGSDRTIIADASVEDRVVMLYEDGRKKHLTEPQKGRFYNPIVSPRGDRVLVHNLLGDHMSVIDLSSGRRTDIGPGISGDWSPGGRRVVCHVARDDGHEITESDLFIVDVARGTRWQVTDTPDRLEMHPDWSPDAKRIAYDDARSGSVFIQTLGARMR